MFNNKVYNVSLSEMTSIKVDMFDDSVYIVEINGAGIQSWREYVEQIESKFEFPTSCIDSQDRYLDWMTDLDWIKKERIVLVINNYNQFLKSNVNFKNNLINDYKETILPFWEEEVERVIVGGKPKSFNVFLVD